MNSQKARHMKAKAKLFGFLLMMISTPLSYADDTTIDEVEIGAREFKVKVSAEITKGCLIGSSSEDFGDIGNIEFDPIRAVEGGISSTKRAKFVAVDSFNLICTPNMTLKMEFDTGLWGNGTSRRLKNANDNYMAYDLVYITSKGQRQLISASGAGGSINVPIDRNGKFNVDIEGVMYMHLMPSPIPTGVYEDTIRVTFTY